MLVKELIEELKKLNPDRDIMYWDCDMWLTEIKEIWEDTLVKFRQKWYNEMGHIVYDWDLDYYENAEEYGYEILSKKDIYYIE